MRKNLTALTSNTGGIHNILSCARGEPGRRAKWRQSTRRIQWVKKLSSKRVRRAIDADIAEALANDCIVAKAVVQAAVVPVPAITVTVKGKGTRTIAREERAFTSPSLNSLLRYEATVNFAAFIEKKANARML